ncbi:MAG TPA: nucleotidyltransferase family protein [Candidatus Eremiobacteraceae bacterium]|nr:nucleotidyltransferase family protein [Candidatus Eremiobacteraceae bacterium]
MKAMVLAAGLGKRLRPLTNERPKALVEVGGRTLLEITLTRLRAFGVREVIINAHHFADAIAEFLAVKRNFGMRIEISREEVLLDTGGGLKKAGWFFREGGSQEPFLLHNVDVISTIDLGSMVEQHAKNEALATLAVQKRETSRLLLFDEQLQLCGRRTVGNQQDEIVREGSNLMTLGFAGIHVISPRMLRMMDEEGVFSIIDVYLRLAGKGEKIRGFRADEYYWRDLGKLEQVEAANRDYAENRF